MVPQRADDIRKNRQSSCPLAGGCTALAGENRIGKYGRCWCRGDDQVRVSRFDLASPLFALILALVATLLTGFFVLDYSSTTVAGDSYHFWGWPRAWRTDMPEAVMLQQESVDFGRVDDGRLDWQDPGFNRGHFTWDWGAFFVLTLGAYVGLRVLWTLFRVASRRLVVARRMSKYRQA